VNGGRYSRFAGVALAATVALIAFTAPASAAPTLRGEWAPLNRCPVDDPAMLAATGTTTVASCLASQSASGSIKIGNVTVTSGVTDLQLGLVNTSGVFSAVPPAGGAIVSKPIQVPGGLLGLMCPSNIPFVSVICDQLANGALNTVTATVEPAGAPSDFSLAAGLGSGAPIVTVPIRIHLSNPFLGSNCFIGSSANPIVLRPANLTAPTARLVRFNPDGTASTTGSLVSIVASGASQSDTTFAVPGASGCGLFGLLNGAVNLRQGLPSAAGNNSIVLNDSVNHLTGFLAPGSLAPNEGRQLSTLWHAAAVS
jgi:hypothetical protein